MRRPFLGILICLLVPVASFAQSGNVVTSDLQHADHVTTPALTETKANSDSSSPVVTARRPWELTDDERLAARFDEQNIQERIAASQAGRVPGIHPQSSTRRAPRFVIDGSRDPELFLKHELFDALLRAIDSNASAKDRERLQAMYGRHLPAAGLSMTEFWSTLTRAAAPYTEARSIQTLRIASGPLSSAQAEVSARDLCRARFTALQAVEGAFGPEKFDKFLYVGVAPSLRVFSETPSAGDAAGLKFIAGGCQ